MIKHTVKFKDIDLESGEEKEVVEDLYFNLTTAEIAELQYEHPEGYHEYLVGILRREDKKAIIGAFKNLILKSYGRRTPEGRFVKRAEFSEEFASSEAYSEFFLWLINGDEANAIAFFNAVIPKDLAEKASKMAPVENVELNAEGLTPQTLTVKDGTPAWKRENRLPTKSELMAMEPAELAQAMGMKTTPKEDGS